MFKHRNVYICGPIILSTLYGEVRVRICWNVARRFLLMSIRCWWRNVCPLWWNVYAKTSVLSGIAERPYTHAQLDRLVVGRLPIELGQWTQGERGCCILSLLFEEQCFWSRPCVPAVPADYGRVSGHKERMRDPAVPFCLLSVVVASIARPRR